MGSDSDLPVMGGAGEVLHELGVPHEVRVVSAHRTPHDMIAYGGEAADRGLRGDRRRRRRRRPPARDAGGRDHAARDRRAGAQQALDGMDSLLSIVQMPRGVPVATVAIDGGRNAGLLAAQILALSDPALARRIAALRAQMAEAARTADAKVGSRQR